MLIQLVHACAINKVNESARAKIIGFCGERIARGNPVHLEMKPRKSFEWVKQSMPLIHNKDIINYFKNPEHKGRSLKHTPEMDAFGS